MQRFSTTVARSSTAFLVGLAMCVSAFVAYATRLDWMTGAVDLQRFLQNALQSMLVRATTGDAVILCLAVVCFWLPLHFLGIRHWLVALALGAILLFLRFFGAHTQWFSTPPAGDGLNLYGWADAAADSVPWAFAGLALAGVMWRVAYREVSKAD